MVHRAASAGPHLSCPLGRSRLSAGERTQLNKKKNRQGEEKNTHKEKTYPEKTSPEKTYPDRQAGIYVQEGGKAGRWEDRKAGKRRESSP
jgi:hypothetical protein